MKSAIYFVEITNQKAVKYLFERGKLESTCLPACLPCLIQEVFCMSLLKTVLSFFLPISAIYLVWYRSVLFFPEFTSDSFYGMISEFKSS